MIYNTQIWLFDSSPVHCCELFCTPKNCKELMDVQILSYSVELTSLPLPVEKSVCLHLQFSSTFLDSI